MRTRHIFLKPSDERSKDSVNAEAVRFLGKIVTLGIAIVAIAGLVSSRNENPAVPLRLWTFVYALQNFYSAFMFMWYPSPPLLSKSSSTAKGTIALGSQKTEHHTSIFKHLMTAKNTFFIVWWIIGVCLVYTGGGDLPFDSPQLSLLCIIFLTLDSSFVLCCATVACLYAFTVCFGIPWCFAGQLKARKLEKEVKEERHTRRILTNYKRFQNFSSLGWRMPPSLVTLLITGQDKLNFPVTNFKRSPSITP